MKREILFRGKRVDNGEWIYGGYFKHTPDENGLQHLIFDFIDGAIEVHENTISQFTGLTDKNGVNIFEGDKLTDGVIIYVVEYNTQNTSFAINPIERLKTKKYNFLDCIKYDQLGNGYYSRKDLEVIGNIHDA